jgi:signal transduction histidine kinase
MFLSLIYENIRKSVGYLVDIGVNDDLDAFQKRKVQLINFASLLGEALCLCFLIYDLLFEGVSINELYLLLLSMVFVSEHWLHSKGKYQLAELLVFYPVVFVVFLMAYRDITISQYSTTEYALIIYLIIGIFIYKDFYNYISIATVFTLYCLAKYIHFMTWNLPFNRYLIASGFLDICFFFSFVAFVTYFKGIYIALIDVNKEMVVKNEIVLSQAQKLKELNTTKDRLFSIISHDLRVPIASLKSILVLFDNKSLTQEGFVELSKHLQQNVDNIYALLENLLLWSLSQMEGLKPDIKKIDINALIHQTIILFEGIASQKQIELKISTYEALFAYADENHIQAVLRNLLNNAIKFTPQRGSVAVHGKIRDSFIELKIIDSGTGIKQEELQTLFATPKLNRGTAGEKGTGLGLLLCKDLIEQNGGTIDVMSEFSKGTTFEILLPIKNTKTK